MRTALDIARAAKLAKPHIRYAASQDNSCVVAMDAGRWVRVAAHTIDGRWVSMPYELLVNGEPIPLPRLTEIEDYQLNDC